MSAVDCDRGREIHECCKRTDHHIFHLDSRSNNRRPTRTLRPQNPDSSRPITRRLHALGLPVYQGRVATGPGPRWARHTG